MSSLYQVELPSDLAPEDAAELKAALREVEGVELPTMRSLPDLATLNMAVGTAAALVPIVQMISGFLRKKEAGGAKITLPNGTVIEAANMSTEEIQKLVGALGG